MKKVLFVATVVKKHIMVFHIPFLKFFKDNGYEVHVCAGNDYENQEDCKIPYCDVYYDIPFERSPFKPGNLRSYNMLKHIVNHNVYDLIHCHTPIAGALTRLAVRRTRKKGTQVVYTAHGFHFYRGAPIINWVIYYPVERWLARYTEVLITINKEDYERAKRSFRAGRVEYVAGVGVDVEKYAETVVDRKEKRSQLGLLESDFVLVSTGELNVNKNHQTVIHGVHKLDNPSVKYLICGQGPLDEALYRLIQKLGLEQQVMLLGHRTDVAEVNHIADVFVLPSFREGLSVALMEAMASGLPCVVSRIRGNVDLIDDPQCLIKPNDSDGFADVIRKAMNDVAWRTSVGLRNRQKIKGFSSDRVRREMQKVYRDTLG